MSVSYEYYKIFYYVAKYHSFNKAASMLYNSQPNITRAINNLESALNCRLFLRSHRGVTLTEEGEALFQYVQAAHRQIELGESMLESIHDLKLGNISIGISIGIAEGFIRETILPAIQSCHENNTKIRLRIINNSTPQLIADIEEDLLDIAIITSGSCQKKISEEFLLHSFRDIVVAGASYAFLCENPVSLQDIVKQPLISLWRQTETYDLYHKFFLANGLDFEPQVETATTSQLLAFTESNMGIAFISPKYATPSLEQKKIFRLELREELPLRTVAMIHSKKAKDSPTVTAFQNILQKRKNG